MNHFLNYSLVALVLLSAGGAEIAAAASNADSLKFANPSDQALYEQGLRLIEKCDGQSKKACKLSASEEETIQKSAPLLEEMNQDQQAAFGVKEYKVLKATWEQKLPAYQKALEGDQKALQDYRTNHPLRVAFSGLWDDPTLSQQSQALQHKVDADSNRIQIAQEKIKMYDQKISNDQSALANSEPKVVVISKTGAGN